MLTSSLNEARSMASQQPVVNHNQTNADGAEIDADTLNAIAQNTTYLKEMEAQLNAIVSFGGIQNSKAVAQAKQDSIDGVKEAETKAEQAIQKAQEEAQN